MQIATFAQVLEPLDQLDEWLKSLGIAPKDDRWHKAKETVKRAQERREAMERSGGRPRVENYTNGLFEALEIHDILRAFCGDTSPALKAKLERALCGPISPFDEQPRNSSARNAMFELSLAADWKNSGIDVELGEPDILIRAGGATFEVECKRPFFRSSVRSNIKDAASQLGCKLDEPGNESDYGFLAISLSRVFSNGNLACFAPEGMGREVINEALDDMLDKNTEDWGLRQFRKMHDRIVAVMFHLAAPWDVSGERLIHLSTSNFIETGNNSAGWEILRRNVEALKRSVG